MVEQLYNMSNLTSNTNGRLNQSDLQCARVRLHIYRLVAPNLAENFWTINSPRTTVKFNSIRPTIDSSLHNTRDKVKNDFLARFSTPITFATEKEDRFGSSAHRDSGRANNNRRSLIGVDSDDDDDNRKYRITCA